MEPSLWQHQTLEPISGPIARDATVQTFASGVLVGIVLAASVLLWRRSGLGPTAGRRRAPILTGWGDLFRLFGGIVRGGLWLVAALLLLGRVLFWPAGRRW